MTQRLVASFLANVLMATLLASPAQAQSPEDPASLGDLGFEQLAQIRVTSVSRRDGTIQQSAAAIFVITAEMIQRSGVRTFPELLRLVPGMNVARMDNNKWAVGARGFNERFGGKLLVQIDGRTLYNPIFSGVYWDTVDYPLEDIDRIEVIRGPGASVWGANAVNGVINIVTKAAMETQGGLLVLGGGTNDRGFGVARYGGALGSHVKYRGYMKVFDRREQHTAHGPTNDAWSGGSGGFRLDWNATPRDVLTFQGARMNSTAGRLDLRPIPTAPYFVTNEEDDIGRRGNLLARWSHRRSPRSQWTLQAYVEQSHRRSDHRYVDLRWRTDDLDFQHELTAGTRHQLVYGFGYRSVGISTKNSLSNDGFAITWSPAQTRTNLYSAFVQDHIRLIRDRLSLIAGTKLEHNDSTGFELQPTLRLLWTPTQQQSVWTSVSRAVRTPSFLERNSRFRTLTSPGVPRFVEIRGNPDLGAEELVAWDAGYRVQATERLFVDVAAFYNHYENLIATRGNPPVSDGSVTFVPVTRTNALHGETYGVEVAADWQLTRIWRMSGTLTALKMNLHRAAGLPASAEVAERQSPGQQATLHSYLDLPARVQFDLSARYVSELAGFNPGRAAGIPDAIDAYVALGARLRWRPLDQLEIAISGENLLDHRHAEFGTSPLTRSPLVELERNAYAKATWSF